MAKIYDSEALKEICQNIDLLEYASQTFEFKKIGDNYFCSCPLHEDRTPSLAISVEKNRFRCFSCGKGGDFLTWAITYEGLPFDKAVEKGIKLSGIDINSICQSDTINFLKQLRARHKPPKSSAIHEIIDKEIFNQYKKTYPDEWLNEGITKESMDKYEIRMDIWTNRIVYPVYDLANKLINIKGRTLYPNYKEIKIPKYINYYKVGIMDYFQGLNIAIKNVKENNEIIIFESIKSVMKIDGWGYMNSVSAEKHTLTPEQVSLLIKLRVNIVFAYDSDISYFDNEVKRDIDKLKRITNVYLIEDRQGLLGGKEAKSSPADCGKEVWETLYYSKRKVV